MREPGQLPPLRIVLRAIELLRGHWRAVDDPIILWNGHHVQPLLALSACACAVAGAAPVEVDALGPDQARTLATARQYYGRNGQSLPNMPIVELLAARRPLPSALQARLDQFLEDARILSM